MIVGDAKHLVCACSSCRSIVNAMRIPFRFEIEPCPECGAPLGTKSSLDILYMSSEIKCPKCSNGRMRFSVGMTMSARIVDRIPDLNTIVHGIFKRGELTVPSMWFRGRTVVTGMPSDVDGRCMELKVNRIDFRKRSDPHVEFEFLRFVQIRE